MTPEEFVKAVKEFKVIYQEEFGPDLSDEDATAKAKAILQLFVCLVEGKSVQ